MNPTWTMVLLSSIVCSPSFFSQRAAAQESAKDSVPSVAIGGFVDTYFSWNFARPQTHTNRFRNFDIAENQFVVSAAEVDFQKTASPIGFRIEASVGSASDVIHSGSTESLRFVQQAYLTAVLPVGTGLTVDAGKFVTHMGGETIKAKDNFNYSRSFLFAWAIPYYHLGVRAGYSLRDNLALTLVLCNGWNNASVNSGKTLGATVSYAPTPPLSLVANWIGGSEQPDSVGSDFRHVFEGIITLQVTDRLTLGVDGMYGTESIAGGTVTWKGVAFYGRYGVSANSFLSARAEVYSDPQGSTTALAQDLSEVTLTYEYRFLANLMARAEYRYDRSTTTVFDGDAGPASRNNQSTLGLACIVMF
jgi:hypothetical protein